MAVMSKAFFFLPLAIATAWQQTALLADESHLRDLLWGGRAAMMGGAYTAISDDPEGVLHNPAGTAFSGRKKFSINGTVFYDKSTRYKEAVKDQDFVQASKSTLPSFIGSTYLLGDFVLGQAIITADGSDTKQTDYFNDISVENTDFAMDFSRFQQESSRYEMYGGSIAYGFGPLGLGISTFYLAKTIKTTVHQEVVLGGGDAKAIDQSLAAEGSALGVIGGVLLRKKAWSLGATYQVNQQLMEKMAFIQDTMQHSAGETKVTVRHVEVDKLLNFDFMYPSVGKAGIAYLVRDFIAAFDLVYQEAVMQENTPSQKLNLHDTLNASLGFEWVAGGKFYLAMGVFTNNDMTRELDAEDSVQPDHVDFVGASFGSGFYTKDFRTTIGFVEQQGSGKSQKVQGQAEVQKVSSRSRMFILNISSAFDKG